MPVTLVIAVKTAWSSFYTVHYHIVFVDFEDIFHAWIFRSLFWRVSVVLPLICSFSLSVCVSATLFCDSLCWRLKRQILWSCFRRIFAAVSMRLHSLDQSVEQFPSALQDTPPKRYCLRDNGLSLNAIGRRLEALSLLTVINTAVKAFLRFLRCPSHKDVATFLLTTSTILQSSSSWRPTTPAEHIRPTSLLCRWPVCLELSTGRAPGSGH